jgi:pimeloyl-ACP methyl ester carboxylesterase
MAATVSVNGVRLSYEVSGDGEPVVLIGGFGMPPSAWHVFQVPAFTAAGFQVVTFANRGISPSSAPGGRYSVAEMALDVAGLIEGLDLGRCRIVGVSLGGFIAQQLACVRHDLVRAAVLMGSAGRTTSFLRAKTWAEREFLTRLKEAASYELLDTLAFSLCPSELQNDDATVDRWVQLLRGQARLWSHPDARLAQHHATWDWILDAGGSRRWSDVTVPCLVMAFEHDLYFPPRVGREAAQGMPRGEFIEIAAAAHAGWFERAEVVNSEILSFFERT